MENTEKLFVYGIFLGGGMRERYGMHNPQYATVSGYITVGDQIVQAVKVQNQDIALTGLLVDVETERWEALDSLEAGYDRIKIRTTGDKEAYMYASPEHSSN